MRLKKEPLQMHQRIQRSGRVLTAEGDKSPWRVAPDAIGRSLGEWRGEMARRRATLDELRVAVDAEKTDKMQENVLPYMLAYSRRRMAGGGDKAPSLAAYHHEVAESIEVVDRTRHRWRKNDPAPPSEDPGDTIDAVHAREVLAEKAAIRDKQVKRMRLRQDSYYGRDGKGDPVPDKPDGMERLERRKARLKAQGRDLNGRENFELQRHIIRWTDSKLSALNEKKRREKHLLRNRFKNKMKEAKTRPSAIGEGLRRASQILTRRLSAAGILGSGDGDGDGGEGAPEEAPERDEDAPLTPRSAAKLMEATLDSALQGMGGRDTIAVIKDRRESVSVEDRIRNLSPAKLGAKVAQQIRLGFRTVERPKTSRGPDAAAPSTPLRGLFNFGAFSPIKPPPKDSHAPAPSGDDAAAAAPAPSEAQVEAAAAGRAKFKKAVGKLVMKNVAFNVTKIRVKKGQEAYAREQERLITEQGLVAKELQRQKDADELDAFGVFADLAPGMDNERANAAGAGGDGDGDGDGDAPAKPKKKHVNLNKIGREAPAPRKQIKRKAVAESKLKPQELGPQYPEGMDVPQVPVHDSRLKPKR